MVFDVQMCFIILPDIAFNRIFEVLNNSWIIPVVISALMDSLCVKPAGAHKADDLDELAT